MKIYEIVIIDSKNRLLIPSKIRDLLGIREGMALMLIADPETREIKIIPLADAQANVYQIIITMEDKPGALARVAQVLARYDIDLLSTESRTIRRGDTAVWTIIADLGKQEKMLDKLAEDLRNQPIVKNVEIVKIRR